jgi:hypothetical protein
VAGHAQIKVSGAYPLFWGLQASATYQDLPGLPITATLAVPNSQIAPALGRNLSACGTQAVCTAAVTVQLIEPHTMREDRQRLLDARLSKNLRVGRLRLQPRLDIYNLLNTAPIITAVNSFGATWLRPTEIYQGRFVKFGIQVDF